MVTAQDGFLEFRYQDNQPRTGDAVVTFDIKTDEYTDFKSDASSIYLRTVGGSSDGITTGLATIKEGKLRLPNAGGSHTSSYNVITSLDTAIKNDWVRVMYVFHMGDTENNPDANYRLCTNCFTKYALSSCDKNSECGATNPKDGKTCTTKLDPAKMHECFTVRVYVGLASTFDHTKATAVSSSKKLSDPISGFANGGTFYYDTAFGYKNGKTKGIDIIRFGLPSHSKTQAEIDEVFSMSYCLDNMAMYNGVSNMNLVPIDDILTIGTADKPYGAKVNSSAAKVIEILAGSGEKSNIQYVDEALLMKVGVKYGLYSKTKKPVLFDEATGKAYGAPIKSEGKVYVPFQAVLDYIGYPSFKHDDNLSYDFATDKGSALLTIGRDTATVNGQALEIHTNADGSSFVYLNIVPDTGAVQVIGG